MQLPTSLFQSNNLDQCVNEGKNLYAIRFILEPHFFTKEIHFALRANWRLRRDVDFCLTIFDDYQRNFRHYYPIDNELADGIVEITLFNLLSRVSVFCSDRTTQSWYDLFLAKKYVDDLPNVARLKSLSREDLKIIEQHSLLARSTLGGWLPHFEILFQLPLSLPVEAGIYSLNTKKIKDVEIKHIKDSTRNSMFGDRNFSLVKVKFWGHIEQYQMLEHDLTDCIELVNGIMTHAKLTDERLRVFMLEHHNLAGYRFTQYNPDGSIARRYQPVTQLTTFFGLANDDETVNTLQLVNDSSKVMEQLKHDSLEIHDRLYASALIDKGNNNYTSAFYQLNSSIESLITYHLHKVCLINNSSQHFNSFMYGDINNVPSNYKQLKELRKQVNSRKHGSITNKSLKLFEANLDIVKGKDAAGNVLRNKLSHGSEHRVHKEVLLRSFNAYKTFKSMLEDKLKQVL